MATSDQRCRRAVMAGQEVILEECEDVQGAIEEVGNDVFVFVSEEARRSFPFELDEPVGGRDRERAVNVCMDTEFAEEYAKTVVGERASSGAREAARQTVCEQLFSL